MNAIKGIGIILLIASLSLVLGCPGDKPPPKTDFQLGKEHFNASNYDKAMIRLETWLQKDPNDLEGQNTEAHAMLAVIYHDNETRQNLYKVELKKLKDMGNSGMATVLKMIKNPTIASRKGGTISNILVSGGELSIPVLMTDFTSANARLRTYAKSVIIKIGKPAVPELSKLLDDPDPYNRNRAIDALSEIGDESVIEIVKAKLADPNKLVQVQAAAALYKMGQRSDTRKIILDALEKGDVNARRVAAKAMAELIDDPPMKPMLKAMQDADADVRNHSARAIGKLASPEATKPLIKMLKEDPNDQVRKSVAEALTKIGKPAVKPLIEQLEGTNDIELTIRLVQTLGSIGDKRAIKPLEKVYNSTNNVVLKDATAKSLNKID